MNAPKSVSNKVCLLLNKITEIKYTKCMHFFWHFLVFWLLNLVPIWSSLCLATIVWVNYSRILLWEKMSDNPRQIQVSAIWFTIFIYSLFFTLIYKNLNHFLERESMHSRPNSRKSTKDKRSSKLKILNHFQNVQ